jgi:hypothetical protein
MCTLGPFLAGRELQIGNLKNKSHSDGSREQQKSPQVDCPALGYVEVYFTVLANYCQLVLSEADTCALARRHIFPPQLIGFYRKRSIQSK